MSMSESAPSVPVSASARVAVLVIDVQSGLFNTVPPPFEANQVIQRINSVTDRARAAKVPVIFAQHHGPPLTSSGTELHPDLNVLPQETVVIKKTGDAFYGTNLESLLRSSRVETLVLMGFATDFCVDSTLRNAVSKNFEVFVVSDAHTTNDAPTLKASVIREYFNWVWSDSSSARGIHLLKAEEVRFIAPAAGVFAAPGVQK
jgi:nicotinamidase-related amidase